MSRRLNAGTAGAVKVAALAGLVALPGLNGAAALAADEVDETGGHGPVGPGLPVDAVPDVRDDESQLTVQKGDIVAVPIPMSSPTFGTGLIVAGAYFYAQTPEQQKAQPASFTGAAGVYTSNDSWAAGIGQQSYWGGDKWRFSGFGGYVDFKFELRDPATEGEQRGLDWDVRGGIFQGVLSRRIAGDWYAGVLARYLDITQDLAPTGSPPEVNLSDTIASAGIGATLEYDTRDVPTNAYEGLRFEGRAIFSRTDDDDRNESYQSYKLRLRNYHKLGEAPFVIAWDINGCARGGEFPLWDSCFLDLRGFPLTDYLGERSISGQIEGRWLATARLGVVAFAGAGHVSSSFSALGDSESVPSYGAGVRFMVLKSKRVNFRVDYARSDDEDAWYVGVGEAF